MIKIFFFFDLIFFDILDLVVESKYVVFFNGLLCGVDEVGCGFWVGLVVIVVVILDYENVLDGLIDFKKLMEVKWEEFYV